MNLVAAHDTNDDALNLDVAHVDRFVLGVGRLQTDAVLLAVELFEGGFVVFEQGDDGLAVAGGVSFFADDVVAVADLGAESWKSLSDAVSAFESAWKDFPRPELTSFVPAVGDELRHLSLDRID